MVPAGSWNKVHSHCLWAWSAERTLMENSWEETQQWHGGSTHLVPVPLALQPSLALDQLSHLKEN